MPARLDELDEDDRRRVMAIGLEGLSQSQASAWLGIGGEASRKRWNGCAPSRCGGLDRLTAAMDCKLTWFVGLPLLASALAQQPSEAARAAVRQELASGGYDQLSAVMLQDVGLLTSGETGERTNAADQLLALLVELSAARPHRRHEPVPARRRQRPRHDEPVRAQRAVRARPRALLAVGRRRSSRRLPRRPRAVAGARLAGRQLIDDRTGSGADDSTPRAAFRGPRVQRSSPGADSRHLRHLPAPRPP